jgi:DNA-binding response OmpR family regulator
MLLEVDQGGIEGVSFCRVVRQSWDVGIMLLLHREAHRYVTVGYQLGADAYMVFPFDERELLTRAQALVRRVRLDRLRKQDRDTQSASPAALRASSGGGRR